MSGFQGADTEQVRSHSDLLRTRAQSLAELRERLEPAVMDESIWRGPDADSFRSSWSSRTAPLFAQLTELSLGRAAELEQHAEEQDGASGADGAGGGGSGGSGGDGSGDGEPSLWDRVTGGLGVYNTFQSLFSKGKKVWDIVTDIRSSARFLNGAEDIFQLAGGTWMYGKKMTEAAFATGKEFSGLAGKLLGKLGVPTGFGTTNFFGFVDDGARWAGDAMPFLTKAAPWVGKALPVLDIGFGGHQMIQGIRNGDTFSAVTGGANMVGGGLMLAGGAMSATGVGAIVGGPLMAAGAIISGGAAVADLGRMVYDNWDSISATAADAWSSTADAVSEGVGAVGDAISDGWNGLTGALGF